MIVTVLAAGKLFVETGVGGYIDLAAQYGLDAFRTGGPIKVDDAEHGAVIGDGGGFHAKLFDAGGVFFDFVGTV